MAWGLLLALGWGLLAAAVPGGPRSLAVLVTAVTSEDGTHRLITITQLDDVKVTYYSSETKKLRITQKWAEEVLDAEYIHEKTQKFLKFEMASKSDIRRWMQLHNQTGGIHTQQLHKSCVQNGEASGDGKFQYAYDGQDFISFDNRTGTWFPAVQVAFIQKQRWETEKAWTQHVQSWLQHECPTRLQRLLERGEEVLKQQVPPEVSVSRRDAPHGPVTLSCRARGFYPRPIHLSWVRDGGDVLAETSSSGILPLPDGTYYTQSSLEIGPRLDEPRYACRVEHSSLPAPALVWAPEKGPLSLGVLAAIVLAALGLAGAAGAGVWLWRRKSAGHHKPGYIPAATKTGEDSTSSSSLGTEPRSAGSRS